MTLQTNAQYNQDKTHDHYNLHNLIHINIAYPYETISKLDEPSCDASRLWWFQTDRAQKWRRVRRDKRLHDVRPWHVLGIAAVVAATDFGVGLDEQTKVCLNKRLGSKVGVALLLLLATSTRGPRLRCRRRRRRRRRGRRHVRVVIRAFDAKIEHTQRHLHAATVGALAALRKFLPIETYKIIE